MEMKKATKPKKGKKDDMKERKRKMMEKERMM